MSLGSAKLLFVFVFVINCVLWSQSRYGQLPQATELGRESGLVKRILLGSEFPIAISDSEKQVNLIYTFKLFAVGH
jgi:sodium/potassium/calcium exchanger 6